MQDQGLRMITLEGLRFSAWMHVYVPQSTFSRQTQNSTEFKCMQIKDNFLRFSEKSLVENPKYDDLCREVFSSNLTLPGDLNEKYTANLHHIITFQFHSMVCH